MINNVKIQYRKPLLELCSPSKKIETVLTDRTQMSAYNINLVEKINETSELTFNMPFNNTKINDQDCEKLVKLNGEYYVIKEISVSDSSSKIIEVKCIHESVELKGILCGSVDVIGVTVSDMFKAIIDSCTTMDTGYKFRGTDIPDTTRRALQNDSEVSVYENLVKMAEVFQAVLEFSVDADGNKQVYLRKNSINRGKYVKKSNGLKQLDITYDSNELFTRLIPFGYTDSDGIELNIMGVNPTGKSYVENYDYFLAKGMTYDEIKLSPRCNQEMIYRDSDIVDENDLYRIAVEELEKCCVPVLDGTIDMVDFSVFEGSALLSPILSEEIIVIDKDINFSIKAKITGIERNYDNPLQTKVTISNVIRYTSVFKDLVHQGDKIDKITSTDSNGNLIVQGSYVQGKIDAHKAQIVGMLGAIEKPEDKYAILFECRQVGSELFGSLAIGSRGILISSELDSKDEWIWRTAINSNSISADEINTGILNADLIKAGILESFNGKSWIDMTNGAFSLANGRIVYNETDGFKIYLSSDTEASDLETELANYKKEVEKDVSDINDRLDGIDEDFGEAFADGIIDEAEASMIKNKLADLNKEKADIDSRYQAIYNNVNLINPYKGNLATAYNSFVVKHNLLIATIQGIIVDGKATVNERLEFERVLQAYSNTTPNLTKAFDDALTNIADNITKEQINDYDILLREDIKKVSDSVGGLEDTMNNSFRDGIIDETEYIAIVESLNRLNTEKTDIDKNYTNLYGNLNLNGTAKTNLKTKYDAYILAHNSLMSYVNTSIGDRVATDQEKTEINRMLGVYNTKLAEYGVAQTEAVNNIADNNANTILANYKKLVDKDIFEINDRIGKINTDVGGAIADGIIEEAETIVIKSSIKELDKEKADIDIRYHEIYQNAGLSNESKLNFNIAYTKYVTAHNNLITQINEMIADKIATETEKSDYEAKIIIYNTTFAELSKSFDSAINEIALSNANSIAESLKEELQGNIDEVDKIAKQLKGQLGDFTADGILDESEKQSIRMMLKTLATEKSDVTNQYNTIYANADLVGTAKSNLSTAYVNYNTGYTSLIAVINSLLTKTTIIDTDRNTLDVAFTSHDKYLATYSQRVNEAIDSISQKKKNDAITDSQTYYNTQIEIDKKGILTTVSNTYLNKSDLISVNFGFRNRALDTDIPQSFTFTNKSNDVWQPYTIKEDVSLNECVVIFDFTGSLTFASNGILRFQSYYTDSNNVDQYSPTYDISDQVKGKTKGTVKFPVTWGGIKSGENTYVRFRADYVSGSFKISNLRVVKGTAGCDWSPAPEDTTNYIDDCLGTMEDDLKIQIDGKIETYNQTTDPSLNWNTDVLKNEHVGDLWYNPSNQLTKRWNGTSWLVQQGAEPLAMEKRRVFTATPTIPYDIGDLWVTSTTGNGEIKTCIKARSTGSYTASEWVAGLKYTDDSLASKLQGELNNLQIGVRNLLKNTTFENNSTNWSFASNVSINTSLKYEGRSSVVSNQSGLTSDGWRGIEQSFSPVESQNVFTASVYTYSSNLTSIDNGATMEIRYWDSSGTRISQDSISIKPSSVNTWERFVLTGTCPANTVRISFISYVTKNGVLYFNSPKLERGNKVSDWDIAPEDTFSYADNLVYDLQEQIDGKIETYNQATDPSTDWTTTDLKNKHTGDLWYNSSTCITKRWSGTAWVNQPEAESLAKTKKRVFTATPTVPYDSGDLWILPYDTSHTAGKKGEILTCTQTRSTGSYTASDWDKKVSYTDDSYAVSVESKLTQRANGIELNVTSLQETAGVCALNNNYAMTTSNWTKTSSVTVSKNTSGGTFLNIYASTTTGELYATCESECKGSTSYNFSMNYAPYSTSKKIYRIKLEQYLTSSGSWSTIKEWTGENSTNTKTEMAELTYSFTSSSYATKFRVWVGKNDGEVFDIWVANINIIEKGGVYATQSSLKVLDGKIVSKVDKDGVGTLIEQNAEAVKIAWNNNSKYVQFESGGLSIYDGSVSDSTKRAVFDQNGNHFWRDGYYLGKIGTNQHISNSALKGIVFDLEYNGAYMSWAVAKTSTATSYTMMWTYTNKTAGSYTAGMLHAGADIDMHNYTLRNVSFENGGITGTMNFVQIAGMNSNGTASSWYNNCKLQFSNGILISGTWG